MERKKKRENFKFKCKKGENLYPLKLLMVKN